MLNQESEANQAEWIEDLHDDLDKVVAGLVQPWNRQTKLANIVNVFETIREKIHLRNEWWSNAKRLDELEARIDSIPDAKRHRKNQKADNQDRPFS